MHNSAAHHTKTITRSEARAQFAMMLCNCPDERLAGFEPDDLARMYRVGAAEIHTMLADERERRAEYLRRVRAFRGVGPDG